MTTSEFLTTPGGSDQSSSSVTSIESFSSTDETIVTTHFETVIPVKSTLPASSKNSLQTTENSINSETTTAVSTEQPSSASTFNLTQSLTETSSSNPLSTNTSRASVSSDFTIHSGTNIPDDSLKTVSLSPMSTENELISASDSTYSTFSFHTSAMEKTTGLISVSTSAIQSPFTESTTIQNGETSIILTTAQTATVNTTTNGLTLSSSTEENSTVHESTKEISTSTLHLRETAAEMSSSSSLSTGTNIPSVSAEFATYSTTNTPDEFRTVNTVSLSMMSTPNEPETVSDSTFSSSSFDTSAMEGKTELISGSTSATKGPVAASTTTQNGETSIIQTTAQPATSAPASKGLTSYSPIEESAAETPASEPSSYSSSFTSIQVTPSEYSSASGSTNQLLSSVTSSVSISSTDLTLFRTHSETVSFSAFARASELTSGRYTPEHSTPPASSDSSLRTTENNIQSETTNEINTEKPFSATAVHLTESTVEMFSSIPLNTDATSPMVSSIFTTYSATNTPNKMSTLETVPLPMMSSTNKPTTAADSSYSSPSFDTSGMEERTEVMPGSTSLIESSVPEITTIATEEGTHMQTTTPAAVSTADNNGVASPLTEVISTTQESTTGMFSALSRFPSSFTSLHRTATEPDTIPSTREEGFSSMSFPESLLSTGSPAVHTQYGAASLSVTTQTSIKTTGVGIFNYSTVETAASTSLTSESHSLFATGTNNHKKTTALSYSTTEEGTEIPQPAFTSAITDSTFNTNALSSIVQQSPSTSAAILPSTSSYTPNEATLSSLMST
ncbi:hypothetical protein NDU88_001137, partial [Pleurodeles waltl]